MVFFASKNEFKDGTILNPRVPIYKMKNEDKVMKRICVSNGIDGCLVAIGGFGVGDIVNIYSCTFEGQVYHPTAHQVPDSIFTGELWILTDTIIEKEFILEITEVIERKHNEMLIDTYKYILRGV